MSLDADWSRVRALVERAFELPVPEREEFLRREADGDEELIAEARALVELDAAAQGFDAAARGFDAAGARAGEPGLPQAVAQRPAEGRRVGPYELRREIGAGGMGRVYQGVRADGAFHQTVAVKLLHFGVGDPLARERFRRERQVLANLQHPGIARLIDGGVDGDGTPYLVMEYVEGRPVDRFCDENRLSLGERVELFRLVCEAVHEAHKNLVVHRDLKPSNILVTPKGEPKLLDFGIAKVLDPEKSAAEPDVTGPLMRLMTPAYASPEQLRGLAITTASDVYALGVVLYKLLTGHLPYRLDPRVPAEFERVVCEEEPPRPSTAVTHTGEPTRGKGTPTTTAASPETVSSLRRTTPRGLRRALAGDLDRIVLQALRKEPQRRYASAEQLSADLQRYLKGLPVLARPDSAAYRARRFIGRNRGSVTAAAVAVLLLAGGLGFSVVQYRRADAAAREEKETSALAQRRLEETQALALDLERQKALAEGRLVELAEAHADLEREQQLADERARELADLSLTLINDVYVLLRPIPGTTQATELVLRTGLERLDRLHGGEIVEIDVLQKLASGYTRLADVQGSPHSPNLGRTEEAHANCLRAVELAEAAYLLDEENTGSAYALATALAVLAKSFELVRGSPGEALECYEHALEVIERLPAGRAGNPGIMFTEYAAHLGLAGCLFALGEVEDVPEHFARSEEAVVMLEERLPRVNRSFERAQILGLAASFEERHGDLDAAVLAAEAALELYAEAIVASPNNAFHEREQRIQEERYADLLVRRGDAEEALVLLTELEAEMARAASTDPQNRQAQLDLARLYSRIGAAHEARQDRDAARLASERRIERAVELLGRYPGDPQCLEEHAAALLAAARMESKLGLFLDAVGHGEHARGIVEQLSKRDADNVLWRRMRCGAYELLGRTYRSMAATTEAAADRRIHLERAVEWFQSGLDEVQALEELGLAAARDHSTAEDLRAELSGCDEDLARLDER